MLRSVIVHTTVNVVVRMDSKDCSKAEPATRSLRYATGVISMFHAIIFLVVPFSMYQGTRDFFFLISSSSGSVTLRTACCSSFLSWFFSIRRRLSYYLARYQRYRTRSLVTAGCFLRR